MATEFKEGIVRRARAATEEELGRIRAFERDSRWLTAHYDELKTLYPDEWVAVLHQAVVAHGTDLYAFVAQAKSAEAEGENVATHFFSTLPQRYYRA